jgi:hypothetical protein
VSARRERKVVTVLFADLVGFTALIASAIPEASPPPPIGMTTVSRSGTCSSSSSPIVPCPAITSSSSKAWRNVAFRSSA